MICGTISMLLVIILTSLYFITISTFYGLAIRKLPVDVYYFIVFHENAKNGEFLTGIFLLTGDTLS